MSVGVASQDRQETKGEEIPMGQESRGLKEVTLASRASSALTPILTPLTLISRTQLEGGLKCTVSRRVVAICARDGLLLEAVSLCHSTASRSLYPFPQ